MSKSRLLIIGAVVALVFGFLAWDSMIARNDFKNYQVKQAFWSGKMSVKNEAGNYGKFFGDITTYKKTGMLYFSKEKLDGGDGLATQPLKCTFQGNSVADVSGIFKYRLPSAIKNQLKLHETYGSQEAVKAELIRNAMAGALKQVGPMFSPEEAFITRRAEFTELVRKQLEDGLYSTYTETRNRTENDKVIRETITRIKKDTVTQKPIIAEPSVLTELGIVILDLVIKDFDFDKLTDQLIQEKKKQEQLQVVARSNAERAKQDAITAKMEGDAEIAKAKATEEVEKIKEVTQAEKAFEVMKLQALEAKELAKKIKAEGEAKAYANKKLNEAGLTPLKRAEIEKETRIGVARELAKWVGPKIVMSGGSSKGGSGLGEAMQIKYLMDIDNGFNAKNKLKK